jgi:uncharacterized protein (DUF2141 family)
MRFISFAAVLLIIGHGFSQTVEKEKGTIIVNVEGVRNTAGQIRVALFKTSDGFPDKTEKAYRRISTPIINKDSVVVEFRDIDFGEYAVAVLHDEDNNGKMKTGIFGIPLEGYAVSNDAKGTFGPPSFNDAKILLRTDTLAIKVKMRY